MALEDDLLKYLQDNKVDAKEIVKSMRSSAELIMYGEMHVGLSKKAEFFGRLIKDHGDRYHASEHFENHVSIGEKVENYLLGKIAKTGLPADLRVFTPVLDAIKTSTSTRGLVFSGIKSESGRDKKIFDNFKSSRALHLKAKRFAAGDPGHFHIGAAHGARLPYKGSAPTTTQLLLKDGFSLATVLVVVDVPSSSSSGGGLTIVAGQSVYVTPVAGGDMIDIADIFIKAGAGTSYGAKLGEKSTPFARIRPAESKSSEGFHKYHDTTIFLA